MSFKSNLFVKSIKLIFNLFSRKDRIKAIQVLIYILGNGFVELLGLAFILPIIYLISDPEKILSNYWLNLLYNNLYFLSKPEELIALLIIILPFFFLLKNLIGVYIYFIQVKFVKGQTIKFIDSQFEKIMKKDFDYFIKTNSNYIKRDIVTIPTDFTSGLMLALLMFLSEIIVAAFLLIAILIYDFKIFTLLTITIVPILLIFYKKTNTKIEKLGRVVLEERPNAFKIIFETIFAYEEIKQKNKTNFFINKSRKPLRSYHDKQLELEVLKNIPNRLIETTAVLSITIIYLLYFFFYNNEMSYVISTIVIYATAAYRLMPSLNRIINSSIEIKNKSYVFEFLEYENKDLNNKNLKINFKNDIVMKDICFSYDEENEILNNIYLKIKKGEKIGIIGESGSGKSTIIKILLGQLKISAGNIFMDNNLINKNNLEDYRNKIGFVTQNYFMLDASLVENIAFGIEPQKIDYKKIESLIKIVELEKFVSDLERGLNTNIGEFGEQISGGQRQRIAIARCLYSNPEIIIFDEATSALDLETENKILKTINKISIHEKITMIFVSHRHSTLTLCDKIYKLTNKKLIEN